MKTNISHVALKQQSEEERALLHEVLDEILNEGQFVGGVQISRLESRIAELCGTKFAVAVASGTDALVLGMRALGIGPGDEVILPANSFIASAGAVVEVGGRPVFTDVLDDQMIDPAAVADAVTTNTKAIMPVHLTGRIADMDALHQIADEHGLMIVEDAAQSIGSTFRDVAAGALGTVGCFSCHPLKNLNTIGDGGIVTTNDDAVAEQVRLLRNHGLVDRDTSTLWGRVSRMDTLKAAVLLARLDRLDWVIARRRHNASIYATLLDPAKVYSAPSTPDRFDTFHTYVIQVDRRDALRQFLAEHGINTAIHYPTPSHLQPAVAGLGYGIGDFPVAERQASQILSLPIHQYLSDDEIETVANIVNTFADVVVV